MGLVKRGDKVYYYRSRRVLGRVVTTYEGAGAVARERAADRATIGVALAAMDSQIAAMDAEIERLEAEVRAADAAWRAERARRQELDRELAGVGRALEAAARGELERAGFYQHHRDEWRRRGMAKTRTQETGSSGGPAAARTGQALEKPGDGSLSATTPARTAGDEVRKVLDDLFAEAEQARPGAVATFLEEEPAVNPARAAERRLIGLLVGPDPLAADVLRRRQEALRRELAGTEPSRAVRLLAERAALCHLAVYTYESRNEAFAELALQQGDGYQKLVDRAHRRLLSALRALEQVRRLAVPAAAAVRVRVAQEVEVQVGISAAPASPEGTAVGTPGIEQSAGTGMQALGREESVTRPSKSPADPGRGRSERPNPTGS